MPFFRAARTTARTAAFMPGASPPLVNTPIVLIINVFSIPPHGKILKRLHSTFAAYAFTIPFLFYYTDISEVVKWYSKKLTSPIYILSKNHNSCIQCFLYCQTCCSYAGGRNPTCSGETTAQSAA